MKKIGIFILLIAVILGLSIGYSAYNKELMISGDGVVRADVDIRIIDLKFLEATNGGKELYNSDFTKDTTKMFVYLPSNSSVTYEVTVINKSGGRFKVSDIISSNFNNIDYLLDDIEKYGVYDNQILKFMVTLANNEDSEKEGTLNLNYIFEKTDEEYAVDKVSDLAQENTEELFIDDKNNIRYYGKTPNNYILFNKELWRIIGVINNRLKIVKNSYFDERMAWSEDSINNWDTSSLKKYLNEDYYNGIENTSKLMISKETFYLGGSTRDNYQLLVASEYYDQERNLEVYGNNPTMTEQYIGLIYPSDYGYASSSNCLSTPLYNYSSKCKESNYLYIGSAEWLQSPTPYDSDDANAIYQNGKVSFYMGNTVAFESNVRPALYLKLGVKITSGDGSIDNPYNLYYIS